VQWAGWSQAAYHNGLLSLSMSFLQTEPSGDPDQLCFFHQLHGCLQGTKAATPGCSAQLVKLTCMAMDFISTCF
jgi:hypothetical protein